ncbi:hypothetical protein QTP88_019366 [Uroleucon formosanum]
MCINYLLMSSFSGGDLRAGKSPAPNKIKPSLSTNRTSDSSFITVTSKKSLRKSKTNLLTPPSPGLQQIINNTPILNTSQSSFNYITDNNSSADSVINNGLSTDNLNDSTPNSLPDVNSTLITTSIHSTDLPNYINMSSQCIQRTFSPDYNGPLMILVECIDLEKNLGNWHPIKAAKFFSTHFTGITNIKPAGSKKIKISFDSIMNANLCLTSDVLLECGFTTTIPSNLIFSFGIIRLDSDFLEEDFLDGVQSDGYGGVAVAIHRSLKSKLIPIDNVTRIRFTNLKIDIIGVEVVFTDSPLPLKVWSCYLPSSSSIPINLWQDIFSIVIQNTLLCGDFNAFHPAWGSDLSSRRGNLIYNTINSLDLCILNDGSSTHVGRPGSSDSAIDLSFCSPDISWYLSWRTLSDPHGSDHIPIIITAKFNRLSHLTNCRVNLDSAVNIHSSFNFNKANWSSFTLQVQNSIASLTNNNPSILSYSTLTSIINNSAESSIPRKRLNSNMYPPSPSWWNSACTEVVKNRTLLFRNFRRSGSMADFLKYRNSCAHTTRLLKSEKRNNWKAFCSNLNPSHLIQHLWTTARRYKNCINPRKNFENDDWFDNFCSKVAPCYVPSASEIYQIITPNILHPTSSQKTFLWPNSTLLFLHVNQLPLVWIIFHQSC